MFDDLASYDSFVSKPTTDRSPPTNTAPSYDPIASGATSTSYTNNPPTRSRTTVLPPSDDASQSQPPALPEEIPSGDNAKVEDAMAIVSDESGISLSELTDDSNFADIGVDSLLSMVIASRFREELNIQLEADFSLFVDCPTVRQLRVFLGGSPGGEENVISAAEVEVAIPSERVSLRSSSDNANTDDPTSLESLAENRVEAYPTPHTRAFDSDEDYLPPLTKEIVLPPVVSDELEVSTPSSSKVIVPPYLSGHGLLTCQRSVLL